MTISGVTGTEPLSDRWKTVLVIILLVVAGKGLAFVREAFIASELGPSASADGYYLALAVPTVIYSLGALPLSMWVTARLAALQGLGALERLTAFYSRVSLLVFIFGSITAVLLVASANVVVRLYAPGLDVVRMTGAATLARIGALAIPALALQAICNGRLFAAGRFLPVYIWLALSGVVGLVVVVVFTPRYGAAGAVWAFVAAGWTSIAGPVVLARPRGSTDSPGSSPVLADDLRASVIYRALVMQLYFQISLLLIYGFGSGLAPGGLSAALFGSKIQTAVYETLAVTAGVLVYPRIAHFLQRGDHGTVRQTMMDALGWLLPATAGLVVLLITCRHEIVSLVYERRAFDEKATRLVAAGLMGYAPGIVGLTLVEILHRGMVLRGRLKGYVLVFACALILNWVCYYILVPKLGVPGLTISSSAGVLTAALGLLIYASQRLEAMDTKQLLLLVIRTAAAASITLAVLTTLRATIFVGGSTFAQVISVACTGLLEAFMLVALLLALGHRWRLTTSLTG